MEPKRRDGEVDMRIETIVLLVLWPSLIFAQDIKSDTFCIRGAVHIGLTRRPVDSVDLFANGKKIVSLSTNNLGQFEIKDLRSGDYTIKINEFKYDTTIFIGKRRDHVIWIFLSGGCEVNKKIAEIEINRSKPRLLLIGGIAPVYVVGQEKFEKQFNVEYYDFGCTPPDTECVAEYNKTIFNYLDNKYG